MNKTILLVEDNPSDEKLTLLAFKTCGVTNDVVVVRDGAAALEYLFAEGEFAHRAGEPPPTVVLLDLKLPKIDGLEVLRRIRANARTKLLPVIILTSSREEEDILRGYALGANAYVRKPVEFTEFIQAAKTLGLFWLLIAESPPLPTRS
jgi:two-component system response regulator